MEPIGYGYLIKHFALEVLPPYKKSFASTRSIRSKEITADGEEIDLTDMEVTVEVPVKAVSMSDEPKEYRANGNIISFIYKGSHYNYTVRTATEDDFVLDEDDLWNEGDHVSLMIPEDQIILKRRQG